MKSHTHSNYALSSHTHIEYVTSSTVSTMINNAMSGGNSVIRKITRGYDSCNDDSVKTISCTITDTSKVIVILDSTIYSNSYTSVILTSITTSGIIVTNYNTDNTVYFSYQIVEFM